MIRDSSLAAYDHLQETGKLGTQAQTILDCIRSGRDYSLQELVKITGYAINAVSGRCNDLKKAGMLAEGAPRRCSVTGRTIHPVKLPARQLELI